VGALTAFARSKVTRFGLAAAILAALVFVAVDVTAGPATYPLRVVYSSAPGLFPGAAVDVLGVKVGTVITVKNEGQKVDVGMVVDKGTRIPANVVASLVAPQLLGQPDIDLNPGYTSGATLASGATISEGHTAVPVSTDEVLKEIQHTLNALNPHAVGDLVTNLAQDLDGQGASLNHLIASAAGTVQLLANKGDDLGKLNGTLAQLTGTLDADTGQIEQLVQQYDTVSGVIAQHSGQLNDAITQLAQGSTSLVNLLVPNLAPLESDVGTVTTVGRTLDRNLDAVDEILQQGNNLFQGASRAYDPNYNWLDLNLELAPGVTGAYVAGLIRDRLAGVCRRILANHGTGLTGAEVSALTSCGDPSSSFFNPLLNEIPTILDALNSSDVAATGSALLQKGLNQILAIEPAAGGSAAGSTPPSSASAPNTTTTTPAPATTTTTTAPKSCGLLGSVLGCGSSSSSSSSKAAGLGSLLSKDVTASGSPGANSTVAVASSAPTLNAPADNLLGPMPGTRHVARHHRGLIDQWAHDVWSLL
jgi:virulence factor Mce-like protein